MTQFIHIHISIIHNYKEVCRKYFDSLTILSIIQCYPLNVHRILTFPHINNSLKMSHTTSVLQRKYNFWKQVLKKINPCKLLYGRLKYWECSKFLLVYIVDLWQVKNINIKNVRQIWNCQYLNWACFYGTKHSFCKFMRFTLNQTWRWHDWVMRQDEQDKNYKVFNNLDPRTVNNSKLTGGMTS